MPFASKVFLVRPSRFGYDPQTAGSNAFQRPSALPDDDVSRLAVREFDSLAEGLQAEGIDVVIAEDPFRPITPNAVFPNNWFSTHPDKSLCLYPMESESRRLERQPRHIAAIKTAAGTERVIDLTHAEEEGRFLEGTGSLVIDTEAMTAYASVSSRTDPGLAAEWAVLTGHDVVLFRSFGPDGRAVYHTNVMMCIGHGFAVVCLRAIPDEEEREAVRSSLEEAGKEVIEISPDQMLNFAGNMLQLRNTLGEPVIVLSETARESLTSEQSAAILKHTGMAAFAIPTLEQCGGGSVRCVIAELF